jgi:hypothetical protein
MTVFPDTNFFLHFRAVREQPWCERLKVDRVKILVCKQVLKELDTKKYDTRLRERAIRALREIEKDLESSSIRTNVTFGLCSTRPSSGDFIPPLQADHPDDLIAATLIAHRSATGEEIALVSDDLNTRLSYGDLFRVISAKDFDRHDLVDPRDTEITKLKAEVARLSSRAPKFELFLLQGPRVRQVPPIPIRLPATPENPVRVALARPKFTMTIEELVHAERMACEGIARELADVGRRFQCNSPDFEGYLTDYRNWLENGHAALDESGRTFSLHVGTRNAGAAQAVDTKLRLSIPKLFSAVSIGTHRIGRRASVGKKPERPSYDSMFKSPLADFTDIFDRRSALDRVTAAVPIFNDPYELWEDANTIHLDIKVGNVMHGHDEVEAQALSLTFFSWDEMTSFKIDAVFRAAPHFEDRQSANVLVEPKDVDATEACDMLADDQSDSE